MTVGDIDQKLTIAHWHNSHIANNSFLLLSKMGLFTLAEITAALTFWLLKKTLSLSVSLLWPSKDETKEELAKLRKAVNDLKKLQEQKGRCTEEELNEQAQSILLESCPDLAAGITF